MRLPMHLLITGMNGTVAPAVAAEARARGHSVTAWQREHVDPNDPSAVREFLEQIRPAAIAHLALGAELWAGQLAGFAAEGGVPFLFTSTAMVFSAPGPHAILDHRTADEDYGRYKIRCEDAIWAANARAMVARIGYQIDPTGVGNNMVAHLDEQQRTTGCVEASTEWLPATAFLADTAAAILDLIESPEQGIHHLDGNAEDALSYAEVVEALNSGLARGWTVRRTQSRVDDQRLIGSEGRIARVGARLGSLG